MHAKINPVHNHGFVCLSQRVDVALVRPLAAVSSNACNHQSKMTFLCYCFKLMDRFNTAKYTRLSHIIQTPLTTPLRTTGQNVLPLGQHSHYQTNYVKEYRIICKCLSAVFSLFFQFIPFQIHPLLTNYT